MANTNDYSGYAQAAASMAASATSAIANSNLDKKNRNWQEQMYAQRLRDERDNWNMQNEYNSPSAVAARMMSAGLNPDVSGLPSGSGVAGSVGSAGDQGSAPYQHSPLDFVGAFANVMEIVQGLESSRLDNQLKKAELDKLSKSTAMDYLVKTYNPRLYDDGLAVDVVSPSKGNLVKYFRAQGLSRAAARQSANYVKSANLNDVRSEYYRRSHDAESNRKLYLTDVADPFFSDFDDTMTGTLNEFLKAQNELNTYIQKAQKAKGRYDANYWNGRSAANDAMYDSESTQYGSGLKRQAYEAGENSSAIDASFEKWVDKQNPTVAMICRLLYKLIGNASFSRGGFHIGM